MKKHGPWQTLSSETVHESPWIKVDFHEVINPGGKPGTYSTVHFKNLAIGIVPIDEEGYTYLVGQYRYPIKQYSWEIPEGGGPLGTDPLISAKRELREEVGIEAQEWEKIVEIHLSNSASTEFGIIYLAKNLSYFEPEPEEDEELVTKKVHLTEFFRMVRDGEITDSLSVVAALKLENMSLHQKMT